MQQSPIKDNLAQRVEERKGFMNTQHIDPIKKREQFAVSLRKKKTQELIKAKRKRILNQDCGNDTGIQSYIGYKPFIQNQEYLEETLAKVAPELVKIQGDCTKTQIISHLISTLYTSELKHIEILAIFFYIRKNLSDDQADEEDQQQNTLIVDCDQILDQTQIIQIIKEILKATPTSDEFSHAQLEAAWILTNLAHFSEQSVCMILGTDSEQTEFFTIIDNLLANGSYEMFDQLLWVINNISGTSGELCGQVTKHIPNLVSYIYQRIQAQAKIPVKFLENCCWTISLLAMQNQIGQEEFRQAFTIAKICLIRNMNNALIINDCVKVLGNLSQGFTDEDSIQLFSSDDKLLEILIAITSSKDLTPESRQELMKFFGGILNGSSKICEKIVIKGFLSQALTYLYHTDNRMLIKYTLWAISNISAEKNVYYQVAQDYTLMRRIIALATGADALSIRQEANWVVCNLLSWQDTQLNLKLLTEFKEDLVKAVCSGLVGNNNSNAIQSILETLMILLQVEAEFSNEINMIDPILLEIENFDNSLEEIDKLQIHPNQEIHQIAKKLMDFYSKKIEYDQDDDVLNDAENGNYGGENDNNQFLI